MRITTLFALILGVSNAAAQLQPESFAARLQGGLLLSLHTADFAYNGDITDCGQLTTASGLNPVLQGILEFPLTSTLGLGIGIGYAGRSGTFSHENSYPIRDGQTGEESTLVTDVLLDATLSYLEIQPDLRLAVLGDYSARTLGFVLGPRIALPLSTSFRQHETIVSPSGAVFNAGGSRTQDRTIAEGPLTTRSAVLVGMSLGAESVIPLSNNLAIVPALSADYFFSSVVNDATWNTFGVRAELGLRFSFRKAQKDSMPPPPPPPPPVFTFAPLSIIIQEPVFNGEVVTGNQLRATTPIVNAVFFDSTSTTIPTSYRTAADGSTPSADPVEAHSWVLPRIAAVLKANPDATVMLEGAGGGIGTAERGRQRAASVQQALQRMGIDASRISVRGSDVPRIQSNPEFAGGREENHRVDIVVRNANLQEWVSTEQFAELRGTLSARVIRSGGDPALAPDAIMSVRLESDTAPTTIRGSQGTVILPINSQVEQGLDTILLNVFAESSGAASKYSVPVSLNSLPRRSIELETNEFEAILRFDYNSSELTSDVKQLLDQLVDKLPQGSTINIYGSADVLGSAERNRQLSAARAGNTESYINSIAKGKLSVKAGTLSDQFSDVTPQGRFLNRCIRITATTP